MLLNTCHDFEHVSDERWCCIILCGTSHKCIWAGQEPYVHGNEAAHENLKLWRILHVDSELNYTLDISVSPIMMIRQSSGFKQQSCQHIILNVTKSTHALAAQF